MEKQDMEAFMKEFFAQVALEEEQKSYKTISQPQHIAQNLPQNSTTSNGPKNEETFSCNFCQKILPNPNHLAVHVSLHKEYRPFNCSICDKRFKRGYDLRVHYRSHSDEKPFVCVVCGKGFKWKRHCQNHEQVHTGIRPFRCGEPNCTKGYFRKEQLTQHFKAVHLQLRPYPCCICEKRYALQVDLRKHVKTHLRQNKTRDKCGDGLTHTKHYRPAEELEKPFGCYNCKEKFAKEAELVEHLEKCQYNKSTVCKDCGYVFFNQTSYQQHNCACKSMVIKCIIF